MLFNGRHNSCKIEDDYSSMILEAKKEQLKEKDSRCQLLNKCFKEYK